MCIKYLFNQIVFLFVLYFFSLIYSFQAHGAVEVNSKWIKETETIYAFSISPRGQVSNPYGSEGRGLTCNRTEGCEVAWELRIGNNYFRTCPNNFTVTKGTTIEKVMPQINSRMMVPCTFDAYNFKGNEQLCLMLVGKGEWFSTITTLSTSLSFVRYGSLDVCYLGGGGGQTGGLTPPIQPANCQVNSQNINLQHSALIAQELNGNRKTVDVNVSCSRNSSINLRMTGVDNNGRLALVRDGSLSSELVINKAPAQKGITINNVGTGGVNVVIASTLRSNGVISAGAYSASAILQITIP